MERVHVNTGTTCLFLDRNGQCDIPQKNLKVLLPEFVRLSAQATGQIELKLQLFGLRDYVGNQSAKEELSRLVLEKRISARVVNRRGDGNISVILEDEKGEVNDQIKQKFRYLFGAKIQIIVCHFKEFYRRKIRQFVTLQF